MGALMDIITLSFVLRVHFRGVGVFRAFGFIFFTS